MWLYNLDALKLQLFHFIFDARLQKCMTLFSLRVPSASFSWSSFYMRFFSQIAIKTAFVCRSTTCQLKRAQKAFAFHSPHLRLSPKQPVGMWMWLVVDAATTAATLLYTFRIVFFIPCEGFTFFLFTSFCVVVQYYTLRLSKCKMLYISQPKEIKMTSPVD